MTRKKGRKLVTDKPVARPPRWTRREQEREDRWSAEYVARVAKKMGGLASRAAQDAVAVTQEVERPSKRRSGKLVGSSTNSQPSRARRVRHG